MNTIGSAVRLTLFGASHDSRIGCVIDGIPAGVLVDTNRIEADLALRKPAPGIGTPRVEADAPEISGVVNGHTTGAPLVITFANTNTKSSDYEELRRIPRPGHADYPAVCKYGVDHDIRGGGMFSGRMTTPLVAAGAVARGMLDPLGITVGSYVSRIGRVADTAEYEPATLAASRTNPLRAMSEELEALMREEILAAKADGDSVGGVVRCMATNLPVGLGEPFFDTLDGEVAKAVFAIPGVKGVMFGSGFAAAAVRGSENNDFYRMKDDVVQTLTNHAGGVLGGMASGQTLDFSVAFKPTPSIAQTQQTVNLEERSDAELSVHGRHDPCIANRGAIVVEAMTALVIADLLIRGGYYG
ncbi:chorismate synthase [Methanorbis rubei]|uniref:Chorismate synthase n=1 Tax=Methanorbis rubei TaxID=3028300 RepID=A0AAE4MH95_9EURY|nr:Chorismate synthase [Methanocorpusculaceae archaeon Cs1]